MTARAAPPPCALPDTPLAGAVPGIMTCVHCGFCLQACPTYLALGDENDSPRGRILLMRALVEGELPPDDADVGTHLDRCLGCRGCETACPSGVPYGSILEAARATLAQHQPPSRLARLVLAVFARPRTLRTLLRAARATRETGIAAALARGPGRIGFSFAMLAASTPAPILRSHAYRPRPTERRGSVVVLLGCVMRGLFGHVHRATERTLAVNGYDLRDAPGQQCCGALHAHAGDLETARRLARANIAAFEASGADYIAVNASGCGLMMKEYGHLLSDDPAWAARAAAVSARARDVSELLADAGPRTGAPLPLRVAYDAPCHIVHGQRLVREPLAVLAAVPGLDARPLPNADQCCGSAGIYNLVEPALALQVLEPKLGEIARDGAPLVATGNPGCIMQIGAGLLRAGIAAHAVHPVEVLDASYARDHGAEHPDH